MKILDIHVNGETVLRAEERSHLLFRRAITLWIILAVAVSVKTLILGDARTVYPIFAAAAHHWWADMPMYIPYEGMDLYRYSPTFAIGLTPFAALPNRLGGILWNLASIAVLVWSLRILVRDVFPGKWARWQEALFLGLALVGSVRGIWSAQSNALVFALLALGAAAVARRRWWAAAFLLTAPVYIKVWPMALLLLVLACWPRQLIPRAIAAGTAFAAVPFLTKPFGVVCQHYHEWYSWLAGTQLTRWPGYRDAWTIWENLFPPVNPTLYTVLQLATAGGVLGWCLWQKRRGDSTRQLLTAVIAMWVTWQLLFGPGTERMTYGIIAPMATWAMLVSFQEKRLRVLGTAAWLITSLLGTGGVERALLPYFSAAPVILPSGVIVFLAWLLLHERGQIAGIQRQEEPEAKSNDLALPDVAAA